MADEWDDSFNWETPGTPQYNEQYVQPPQETPPVAPAASGLKAKSWGKSSSNAGTEIPAWLQNWGASFFGNQGLGTSGALQEGPGGMKRPGTPGATPNSGLLSPAGGNLSTGFNWLSDAYNQMGAAPKYQGNIDSMVGGLDSAYQSLLGMPGMIDKKRQLLIDQIYANAPKMKELYQPAMEDMSRRGILNSSITGDALTQIQDKVNQAITGQVAGANTWAADADINHTNTMPTQVGQIIQMLAGAGNNFTNFQKDKGAMGTGFQGMVNSLLDYFKTQKSGSTSEQGSETYNV